MSLHRWDAKRDANEPEIVKVFESYGFSVCRLDTPLDLIVGFDKRNFLIEIKMPGKGLNENQKKFTRNWKGQFIIIDSVEQAMGFCFSVKNEVSNASKDITKRS